MPNTKFSLQINEPCSQNWDEMTQQEKGRFCAHCTKVVVDFTIMTENQIIDFFKKFTGEVCGRMHHHQLEYTYVLAIRKAPWYKNYFLQFALSGLLTLKLTDSTSQQADLTTEQYDLRAKEGNKPLSFVKEEEKKFIEGIVLVDNDELRNTRVTIKETGQTLLTDSTGKFYLELPSDFKGKLVTITFLHSGYETESRILSTAELPAKNLIVRMQAIEHIKMGKIKYIPKK